MTTTLPERVEIMMAALNLNQTELGDLAEVTKGTISQWLQGITKQVDAAGAFALQKKTGYSAEWIIFGTGPVKIEYTTSTQALSVLSCMEKMDKPARDQMVKISIALVKPDQQQNNT